MRRFGLVLALSAGIIILIWGARVTYLALVLQTNVRALSALQVSDLKNLDVPATAKTLRDSRESAQALQTEAYPLLFPLRYLTFIPELAVLPPLINLAADLTQAADDTFSVVAPVMQSPSLQTLGTQAQTNRPRLIAARAAVARAKQERASLPDQAALNEYVRRIDRLLPLLDSGLALLDVLSADEPRTFLLLAQNQDELRATGGFISGAGLITLEQGQLKELKVEDAYTVDNLQRGYPAPPAPLQKYMGAQLWLFRDANWSADFPTSAQNAASLYALGRNQKVSGVIAFDQTAIKNLVAAIGPIRLPYVAEPITAANLESYMQSAWSTESGQTTNMEWWAHRKDFMRDLGQALLAKLLNDPKALNAGALLTAVQTTLDEKHVLVFMTDPSLADTLASRGWDGALRPAAGDYLFVVETNVGFNKANANLQKAVTYQVNLAEPSAQLQIRYMLKGSPTVPCKHEAQYGTGQYADLINRCYWNYLRVYAPHGATLKSYTPLPTPADMLWSKTTADGFVRQATGEGNTTEYNQFFVVKSGSTLETALTYTLPVSVKQRDGTHWRYTLKMQKQAGTGETAVRVQISLPPGTRFLNATPAPSVSDNTRVTFDLLLKQDTLITLVWE